MEQRSQEWLDLRKNYIGASDAPIIMGVSPFKRSDGRKKTPYVLWMEKLELLPPDKENAAMRYGNEMEETARSAYEKEVGDLFMPEVVFHPDISYLMASLDGLSMDKKKAVEIKMANAEDHDLACQNKIPEKYYPQVQQQLACTGLDGMHYYSFHQGKGKIVEVERNDTYLEEMYSKEKEFWECLVNFEPPTLDKTDFQERDEEWYKCALELAEIKDKRKELTAAEKELTHKLRSLSSGQSSFYKDLRYIVYPRKGSVDYSKIPELQKVDLEKYRNKPTEIWKLTGI